MTTDDPGRLEIKVEARDAGSIRVSWVRVQGEVDLANADQLSSTLSSPSCTDSDALVLDLRELDFIDSSGIRVLLLLAAERKSVVRTLVQPDSAVAKLFDVIDISPYFHLVPDEAQAISEIERSNGSS